MDWDLKVPSWDLSELDRDAVSNISIASSNSLGCQRNELGCSVDLKLGRFGDSESFDKWKEQLRRVPTTVVSTAGSSKRTRVQSNGNQSVSCLVDGCKSDLSNCRGYHRRHKVCEVHSKTPTVLVGGQEQRFCQQCSRFHLLVEFDEVKRSCRKRLDGHNRRRRKPQPDMTNSRSLFLNLEGPMFSSCPRIFSTATASEAKLEADSLYGHQQPFHLIHKQQQIPSSYFHSHKDGMQFPFLQDDNAAISFTTPNVPSVCQHLDTVSSSESCNRRIFTGGLTQVLNSDRAFSLLSSPTIYTPTISLQNMAPSNEIPLGTQCYGNLAGYSRSQVSDNVSPTGFSCSRIDDGQASTALVSDASDAALHCDGIFPLGSDGSSNGHSQALPFSWAAVKSPEVSTIMRNLDRLSAHFV